MDRNEALRILGLEEDSSRDKIEIKYENLMRRIRNGEELDLHEINSAYDLLTGRIREEEKAGKLVLLYRKVMFNYRGWIILSVIVIGLLASLIVPMINKRVPDLTISFAGKYGSGDIDSFDEYLQEMMPETEDILVEVMYLDEEGESGEFDTGGRTRLSALLLTDDADILITDDTTFNYIRQDDALMSLDEMIERLNPDLDNYELIYGIEFSTGQKKIFGIDIGGNKLADDAVYGADIQIICVAERTQHPEAVEKAMGIILKDRSE